MNRSKAEILLTFAAAVFLSNSAYNVASQAPIPTPEVSRERREQAYAKMMEGQRLLWKSNPMRSRLNSTSNAALAKAAFQKAVELDPDLSEAYTALAEIAITSSEGDIDQAISLSALAIKIDHDNFGSHRMLGRLYTYRSRLNLGTLDPQFAEKATAEWKEVTRLDPRNAEGWAFLSEFYAVSNKTEESIDALRKWISSAQPLEPQFYRGTMRLGELSSDRASVKLARALIASGKASEALTVISDVVADDPDNAEAVDILEEAIETAGPASIPVAVNVLAPAVYSDPGNTSLVNLLANIHARSGHLDEALGVLRNASDRIIAANPNTAALYAVTAGDLLAATDKNSDAVESYEKALELRGVKDGQAVADRDREFVVQVFEKIIGIYKNTNGTADVKAVIERSRKLLGKNDLFADKQTIALYRESGNRQEALAAIRLLRTRRPDDYGLVRLEATLLAEMGSVDEGVALIKQLITPKSSAGGEVPPPPAQYDNFTNYIFIAHLYSEVRRGNEAIIAGRAALDLAGSDDRRQLAKLAIATGQQVSGDYAGAEATLRDILKQTPGNPIALNNLGYFLLERNERISEAAGLIRMALKIDPNNPSYLDSFGWANFILGNLDEAEKSLRSAARIDAASATVQEHLGDLYDKQGKADQARTAWRRALELATNQADAGRIKAKLDR